jgi:hypothetical protein
MIFQGPDRSFVDLAVVAIALVVVLAFLAAVASLVARCILGTVFTAHFV